MFPTTNILQPSTLTVALFPHLHCQPYPAALFQSKQRAVPPPFRQGEKAIGSIVHTLFSLFDNARQTITSIAHFPIELTRHECRFKRKKLEEMRDERATFIGQLLYMQTFVLDSAVTNTIEASIAVLQSLVNQATPELDGKLPSPRTADEIIPCLETLVSESLPTRLSSYSSNITEHNLERPSRFVRSWPKLLFLPPLAVYGARTAYSSRASLEQVAKDAVDTLKHFWQDWLLAPIQDVLQTVRTGSDEGVIITHESVRADLDVRFLLNKH
jgi:nuclear control of ATPase protein 2